MPDEQIDRMPLVERFKKAEYLARELDEHLQQAYLPRLAELRTAAKVFDPDRVSDQEILDKTQTVLRAEEFTEDVFTKLQAYMRSIQAETEQMFGAPRLDRPSGTDDTRIEFDETMLED